MAAKFVSVDHDTPLLLPPDLRDWVGPDHMVHFIMDAVDALDLSTARVNQRGTGSAQYPPSMMLGLLIYCYATGTFSSRRIETLTYENVAVRYLSADTHPDHDSICKFRRENKELLSSCFHQVLEMAARAQVLKVGDLTVAVDGTKILANASKHSAMSHEHLEKQLKLAEEQIEELLAKAEDADSTPLQDGLSVPDEIKRREDRIAKLKEAKKVMEERAKQRFEECFNAQAAVEVETMLVVGQHVCNAPNDKQQLEPTMDCISPAVGKVSKGLADSGYYSEHAVRSVENSGAGPTVYAAMQRHPHGRSIQDLEKHDDPPAPPPDASMAEIMAHRLATEAGKDLYGMRKQTVEPVFGIIKEVLGFRRFLLRGLEKVNLEWTLVNTSYNLKRLFNLGMRPKRA